MTKDTFSALFVMQVRGALSAAFLRLGVEPTLEQWNILDGDPTLREIGEICHALDVEPVLTIVEHVSASVQP